MWDGKFSDGEVSCTNVKMSIKNSMLVNWFTLELNRRKKTGMNG